MTDRKIPEAGLKLEGVLRGLGDLLHQAAAISAGVRQVDAKREGRAAESRMTIRTLDGEEVGGEFFRLRDLILGIKGGPGSEKGREPSSPDRREPPVDTFVTDAEFISIVELPGADPDTLSVRVEEDMLTISATGTGVEYATEALLPDSVDDGARAQSFRNGVLELRWPRGGPSP